MLHPFRNIIGIVFLISAVFIVGEVLKPPAVGGVSLLTVQVSPAAIAVSEPANHSSPSLKTGVRSEINLDARAFLSAYIAPDGKTEILVEKEGHKQLPIASVTKLMTALVASTALDPTATTMIEKSDLSRPVDDPSGFKGGEVFTVKTLFDSMLVESSNYSANALARLGGGKDFIQNMNNAAKVLGMEQTYYSNPSGLDESGGSNFSSAYDLLVLAKEILNHHPEILTVTRQVAVPITEVDGKSNHLAQSTDQLLSNNNWPAEIIGGKTGTTALAKKNLVLILKDKASGGYLINVVLGSDDHFAAMTTLVDWVYSNYDL